MDFNSLEADNPEVGIEIVEAEALPPPMAAQSFAEKLQFALCSAVY